MSLTEIGPRFVLTPIRIFEGAFSGATVYSNPGAHPLPIHLVFTLTLMLMFMRSVTEFVTPAAVRSAMRREKGEKYGSRKDAQAERGMRRDLRRLEEDELAVSKVFA